MGLTMREKQAVTREMALVCKRAPKQRKGQVLDSLTGLTEYTTARTLPGCCDNGRAMWAWARGGGVMSSSLWSRISDARATSGGNALGCMGRRCSHRCSGYG